MSEVGDGYSGSLQLQLNLASNQALAAKGAANKLVLPWLAAEQLAINGSLVPDLQTTRASSLSIQGSDVHLAGGPWQSLQLNASGTAATHQLRLQAEAPNKHATISLSGHYAPASQRWHGTLDQLHGAAQIRATNSALQLEQAVPIALQAQHPQLQLGAFCLRLASGKLCTEDTRYVKEKFVLDFALQQFDFAALQPLLPENMQWAGTLSGNGSVQQARGKPAAVQLMLQGSPGNIISHGVASPVQLDYQTLQIEASSSAQRFDARLALVAQQQSQAEASLSLSGKNFGQLDSNIRIENFPVGILAPLAPAAEIVQARLDLDLKASGATSAPVLFGSLSLAEGRFKLKRNASYLTDMQLQGNFNNTQLDLAGSFRAGEGKGRIDGQLNFSQPVQGQLKLSGERLQIDARPLLNLWSDFDIDTRLSANSLSISGDVVIPEGKIEIKQLPRSAQKLSRDVTFVN
ncbi:MAG: hypothetical protein HKO07_08660, partial [Pseudomonadales bacterium]|nr:hypothetical protein [Pseudomonadales bacterium]